MTSEHRVACAVPGDGWMRSSTRVAPVIGAKPNEIASSIAFTAVLGERHRRGFAHRELLDRGALKRRRYDRG